MVISRIETNEIQNGNTPSKQRRHSDSNIEAQVNLASIFLLDSEKVRADESMETNSVAGDTQTIAPGSIIDKIHEKRMPLEENLLIGPGKEQPSPLPLTKTPETTMPKTPEAIAPKNGKKTKEKHSKKLIQDMSSSEINEINDAYQLKYPTKSFGVILQSNNLHDKKWDNYEELISEIVTQTGIDKYSVSEACVVHDLSKGTCHLVLKVDEYEDFKIIRDLQNWSQKSFGGTILSVKQMPFVFRQNNFDNNLELILNVKHGTVLTPMKIKQCEDLFHLTGMERIMTNDGDKLIPTNRYKTKANHVFAYVSACNNGIILASIKYMPETVTNLASLCQKCGLSNCRSSKKKPCQSKPRCMRCSMLDHSEVACKNKEFCINCQRYGHRCYNDGYCTILQQKTFDNNAYLLEILIGEGIKPNKYAILRNTAIAIANAAKSEEINTKEEREDALKEICSSMLKEQVLPRISNLETGHAMLESRCDKLEELMTGVIKTQNQQTAILTNVQNTMTANSVTANQTNSNVNTIMEMISRMSANQQQQAQLTPPHENKD